jgi:hypothetical protein
MQIRRELELILLRGDHEHTWSLSTKTRCPRTLSRCHFNLPCQCLGVCDIRYSLRMVYESGEVGLQLWHSVDNRKTSFLGELPSPSWRRAFTGSHIFMIQGTLPYYSRQDFGFDGSVDLIAKDSLQPRIV